MPGVLHASENGQKSPSERRRITHPRNPAPAWEKIREKVSYRPSSLSGLSSTDGAIS
jgi:hypothetical protein